MKGVPLFNRDKTMADEDRLPLQSVLKHILPTLVEFNLEDLAIDKITSVRKKVNNEFPPMTNSILLDIFQVSL